MNQDVPPPSSAPHDVCVAPWSRAFTQAGHHGVVVGVHLPPDGPPPGEAVLQRLHPRERMVATSLEGRRQAEWVGGRLALQQALKRLHSRRQPFLVHASGAVMAPRQYSASVSHKRDLCVGLLGQLSAGTVGVDVECLLPDRSHLASRILTPGELEAWEALPAGRRWSALLMTFSIKESIYKAIHPRVQRYVGFQEVEITLRPDGSARVDCLFEHEGRPLDVEARYFWVVDRIVTTARLRVLTA
ncbi:MAG: 4'-phosphopantetheinyl transferase superfamily protein [Pseudomonadota bacterium]